jgi:hypothetical protein
MNDECKITLQQRGLDAIREYYERLNLEVPHYEIGDTYTGPLWEVMNIFGSKTYMGPPPPFNTEIEINYKAA